MKVKTLLVALAVGSLLWIPSGAQSHGLYLKWVGVVDNGEGDGMHGPYGNLHVTVYDSAGNKRQSFVIRGPSRGEFLDGDEAYYDVYLGTVAYYNPAIRVKIWESDPGPFRGHDTLFDGWIRGPGLFPSTYRAPSDAVRNALRRGANRWAKRVWPGGVAPGIPKMFVEIR